MPFLFFVSMEEIIVKVFYDDQEAIVLDTREKEKLKDPEVKVLWEDGQEPVSKPEKLVPKPSTLQPKKIDEIQIRQGELYRQKCKLANKLVDIVDSSTQEQRKALVDQIMQAKEEYNHLAITLKHWKETGQLPKNDVPEKVKLTDLQKHELLRRRTNTAANLSKKKNMVKKYQHQPGKLVKYQNEQAKLQAEIQEIDELLRKG